MLILSAHNALNEGPFGPPAFNGGLFGPEALRRRSHQAWPLDGVLSRIVGGVDILPVLRADPGCLATRGEE